jgi:hypothetical protein
MICADSSGEIQSVHLSAGSQADEPLGKLTEKRVGWKIGEISNRGMEPQVTNFGFDSARL